MNQYTIGTLVRISAVITNLTGIPVDPTAVTAKIMDQSGTVTDLSGQVARDALGNFHVDFIPNALGTYQYEFQGSGSVMISGTGEFTVKYGF